MRCRTGRVSSPSRQEKRRACGVRAWVGQRVQRDFQLLLRAGDGAHGLVERRRRSQAGWCGHSGGCCGQTATHLNKLVVSEVALPPMVGEDPDCVAAYVWAGAQLVESARQVWAKAEAPTSPSPRGSGTCEAHTRGRRVWGLPIGRRTARQDVSLQAGALEKADCVGARDSPVAVWGSAHQGRESRVR